MLEALTYIRDVLNDNNIPYEYGIWSSNVNNLYFVGTYDETSYKYEDNHTLGVMTLNGWSRNNNYELLEAGDTIKELFENCQAVYNNHFIYIVYENMQNVPSGVEGLYHIVITLTINTWEGE